MTRVLFCDHPEDDFLAGVLYLGFCQELGPENVVDFPYKGSYHGEVHRYPSIYGSDSGSRPWESWNQGAGCTAPFAWMPSTPGRVRAFAEIVQELTDKAFD